MCRSKFKIDEKGRECSKCGEYKEWLEFSPSTKEKSGYKSRCKSCGKKEWRAYREKQGHIVKVSKITESGRECSRCEKFKEWFYFPKDKTGIKGRGSCCSVCVSTIRKGKYVPIPEKYKIEDTGRECTVCGYFLEWGLFSKSTTTSIGYYSQCKKCRSRTYKEKYGKPPKYRITEEGRECSKCQEFKEWKNYYSRKGRQTHRSSWCKSCVNQYVNHKRSTNPLFKFTCATRHNIQQSFRRKSMKKTKHSEELLGCSIQEFRDYIEAQFTEGMSWDNYGRGGWHLDHIKPLATANTEQEVLYLCHYTNYQPLWEQQNYEKGPRYNGKDYRYV